MLTVAVVEVLGAVVSLVMVVALEVYLEVGIGVKLATVGVATVGLVHFHMVALKAEAVGLLALVVSMEFDPVVTVVNLMALDMMAVDLVAVAVFSVDFVMV